MNCLVQFAQLSMPSEIVSVLGGGLVLALGWQIKLSISLLRDVAVIQTRLDEILQHCPLCKPKT